MKILFSVLMLGSLLFLGCGKKADATGGDTRSTNPLDAPGDYLGAMGKAHQSAVKTVDTTALNQAIQLFQVDKGRNPKDLKELVTEGFLPRIPEPPTGHVIVYDAASGTVKVVKQQP